MPRPAPRVGHHIRVVEASGVHQARILAVNLDEEDVLESVTYQLWTGEDADPPKTAVPQEYTGHGGWRWVQEEA